MAIEYTFESAAVRLRNPDPLNEEEARGLFRWVGEGGLGLFLSRVQMDLALQQIAAINRFDKASAKWMKVQIVFTFVQAIIAAIAVGIALLALVRGY